MRQPVLLLASWVGAFAEAIAQETPPPARVEATREKVEPSLPPVPRFGDVRLAGTAVALDVRADDKGGAVESPLPGLSGVLELYHRVDGAVEVPIRDGEWEAFFSVSAPAMVGDVVLDGRSLELEPMHLAEPWPASVDLRARFRPEFLLDVVDAESGAPLRDIEMVPSPPKESYSDHPGPGISAPPEAKGLASPLRLARLGSWFIRAPGHAWQEFHYFARERQENRLELPRACRLTIVAHELDPAGPAVVRIEPANGGTTILTLRPNDTGTWELDSLAPGRVQVCALLDFHRKPWFWHTVTLGSTWVTLATGEPARAEIVVGPPPPGLHPDGTVDRRGFITLAAGEERVRSFGDGELRFEHVSVDEPATTTAGSTGSGGDTESAASGEEAASATPAIQEIDAELIRSWSSVFEQLPDGTYDMSREYRAEIRGGELQMRVPYGCHLYVKSLVLDGTRHRIELIDTKVEPFEIALGGDARASAWLGVELDVFDADTKESLTAVQVVRGSSFGGGGMPIGGPVDAEDLLVKDARSPIRVPAPDTEGPIRRVAVWVGAEGYAWERIELRGDESGVRPVPLARGARLLVEVTGDPPEGSVLRVHGAVDLAHLRAQAEAQIEALDEDDLPEGVASKAAMLEEIEREFAEILASPVAMAMLANEPIAELPCRGERRLELAGLPRAKLTVSCELGDWFREPQRFASAEVDLAGEEDARARLHIAPMIRPAPMALEGTVFVPGEWGRVDFDVTLKPERVPFLVDDGWTTLRDWQIRRDASTPGLFHFDFDERLPGEYELAIDEFGFERSFTLAPGGIPPLVVVIAPPCDVTVHVIDDGTGEPIVTDRLSWWSVTEEGGSLNAGGEAGDGKRSTFRFRVPQGRIALHVWQGPYEILEEEVDAFAGDNEFTIRLKRRNSCKPILMNGDQVVPWGDESDSIVVTTASGTRVNFGWSFGDGSIELHFAEPGRYRLLLPRIKGFRKIEPVEVEILKGQTREVRIEMVRER
jgi:hypothetical protein